MCRSSCVERTAFASIQCSYSDSARYRYISKQPEQKRRRDKTYLYSRVQDVQYCMENSNQD